MKKIISIFLLGILLFVLGGCRLAISEEGEELTKDYFIPAGIEVTISDSSMSPLDIDGLFNWSWSCSKTELDLSGSCFNYGEGFFIDFQGTYINQNEVDGETTMSTTFKIETSIYYGKDLDGSVAYSGVVMSTMDCASIVKNSLHGMALQQFDMSNNFQTTGTTEEGWIVTLDFTINYYMIDTLQTVEFLMYDDNNQYLGSVAFNSKTEMEDFIVNPNASYMILIETYMNENQNYYKERSFYNQTTIIYYSPKFLSSDGFVHNDSIKINWETAE
ncbi:MAG: hypothetical protein PHC62_07265 [Candidatus Izemoplasmatales bacterium]|nr:hypothetical protein [Candidatus Izemoplasmatales bacterium]